MAIVGFSWRGVLLVGLLAAGALMLARPVASACQRPVSAFQKLVELRDAPSPARAAPTRGMIDAILLVKESDYLAFPLHAAAGAAFEKAGCAPDAVRDQWRKAAMHSFAPFAAEISADGLRRTAPPGADLPRMIGAYAAEMPWFTDNLLRVSRALDAS